MWDWDLAMLNLLALTSLWNLQSFSLQSSCPSLLKSWDYRLLSSHLAVGLSDTSLWYQGSGDCDRRAALNSRPALGNRKVTFIPL